MEENAGANEIDSPIRGRGKATSATTAAAPRQVQPAAISDSAFCLKPSRGLTAALRALATTRGTMLEK